MNVHELSLGVVPVRYIPRFLACEEATELFDRLRTEVPWERRVSRVYVRDISVPQFGKSLQKRWRLGLIHGHPLHQLFKPVQDDIDFRRRFLLLLSGPNHQEPLAVGRRGSEPKYW